MRKLPIWIPQTPRPFFDPDFRAAWDAMTPDERRWSFLIDVAIIAVYAAIGSAILAYARHL